MTQIAVGAPVEAAEAVKMQVCTQEEDDIVCDFLYGNKEQNEESDEILKVMCFFALFFAAFGSFFAFFPACLT